MVSTIVTLVGLLYIVYASLGNGIGFLDQQSAFIVGGLLLIQANILSIEEKIDKKIEKKL